eukprot:1187943-Prorocentrum_minimum.AAC.3
MRKLTIKAEAQTRAARLDRNTRRSHSALTTVYSREHKIYSRPRARSRQGEITEVSISRPNRQDPRTVHKQTFRDISAIR